MLQPHRHHGHSRHRPGLRRRHRLQQRGAVRLARRLPELGRPGKLKRRRRRPVAAADELGGQPECLLLQVGPLQGEASRVHLLNMLCQSVNQFSRNKSNIHPITTVSYNHLYVA